MTGSGRGLVFCEKLLDSQFAEIGQGTAKRFMVPVPPLKLRQPVGNVLRKTPLDRPRRIYCDNRVGRYVLGHDRASGDHGAGADAAARQHDGAVPDPDMMANMDVMLAPPFEELRLVALSRKIGPGAKGEVRLRRAVHGMIAGIDPRHGCDRAEPSDRGVGDLRVVHDVGIIAQRDLMQDRAGADFAIHTERCRAILRWDPWSVQPIAFCRPWEFSTNNRSQDTEKGPHVIDGLDDRVMTNA